MQSFIVLASLVSELAGGGQNDPPPLVLNVTKNTLVFNDFENENLNYMVPSSLKKFLNGPASF